MELVKLMYEYINKIINSDELLTRINALDLTKYSKEETIKINKLKNEIQSIKNNTPNELDKIETARIKNLDQLLTSLEKSNIETTDKNYLYDKLVATKEKKRDSGKLYSEIFTLLTQNKLINYYANKMNDKELFYFITNYLHVMLPPTLNQNEFNDLAKIGIEKDERELLWRLALNYNHKNISFTIIEDYFIKKRDTYYLTELISVVKEDLDINELLKKIIYTNDKEFINEIISINKELHLFEENELSMLKNITNS